MIIGSGIDKKRQLWMLFLNPASRQYLCKL